jgi:hypothetical protein
MWHGETTQSAIGLLFRRSIDLNHELSYQIREIRIRIYLPLWSDRVMIDLQC